MQETWVLFLDQEDPLEKGMETHSSILAWRIPWTEEPGSWGEVGAPSPDTVEEEGGTVGDPVRLQAVRSRSLLCDTGSLYSGLRISRG